MQFLDKIFSIFTCQQKVKTAVDAVVENAQNLQKDLAHELLLSSTLHKSKMEKIDLYR